MDATEDEPVQEFSMDATEDEPVQEFSIDATEDEPVQEFSMDATEEEPVQEFSMDTSEELPLTQPDEEYSVQEFSMDEEPVQEIVIESTDEVLISEDAPAHKIVTDDKDTELIVPQADDLDFNFSVMADEPLITPAMEKKSAMQPEMPKKGDAAVATPSKLAPRAPKSSVFDISDITSLIDEVTTKQSKAPATFAVVATSAALAETKAPAPKTAKGVTQPQLSVPSSKSKDVFDISDITSMIDDMAAPKAKPADKTVPVTPAKVAPAQKKPAGNDVFDLDSLLSDDSATAPKKATPKPAAPANQTAPQKSQQVPVKDEKPKKENNIDDFKNWLDNL